MKGFKSFITGIVILSAAALILTACGSGGGGGGGGGNASGNTTPPAVTSVNLAKTGQTVSYDANNPPQDDGALQRGVAWPAPRHSGTTNTFARASGY